MQTVIVLVSLVSELAGESSRVKMTPFPLVLYKRYKKHLNPLRVKKLDVMSTLGSTVTLGKKTYSRPQVNLIKKFPLGM